MKQEHAEWLMVLVVMILLVAGFIAVGQRDALKSETCCVKSYLYGKLKIGWVVWERA